MAKHKRKSNQTKNCAIVNKMSPSKLIHSHRRKTLRQKIMPTQEERIISLPRGLKVEEDY